MLMSAEVRDCVTWFIYFLDLLYVRYNCAKFHHWICLTDFRERGLFAPPPHLSIREQPRKCPSWIRLRWLAWLIQNSFMDRFSYNFVIEKSGILSENLETLTSSNNPRVSCFFCWNFAHVSYLPISTKGCLGFFLFCLDLELFAKIRKTWFLHTHFLYF